MTGAGAPAVGLRASGGFVWRTPLLPVEEFHAWGADLAGAHTLERAGTSEELDAALAADRATLRRRLATAVERPEVREAIAVAAPDLEATVDRWIEDPASKRGRRAERGLVRYLTRMATRPTPFGLFAGVSTGVLGAHTSLTLAARGDYRRCSQIDTDVLSALADRLAREAALRDHAEVRPNDSIYRVAGQVRYVQVHQDGPRRAHRLATLPDHPAVRRVLDRAERGATVAELADALVGAGYGADAARRAVGRLVERQALVADLGLGVTGPAPLRAFVEDLRRYEATRAIAEQLAEAAEGLAAIDAAGLGASPEQYRTAAKAVRDRPGAQAPGSPFHVVLTKPAPGASLGPRVRAAVEHAVTVLHAQARMPEGGPLEAFRDAFVRRYDTREIPLVEALDGEAGVGYGGSAHPAPLLRGLAFPGPPATERWTRREALLLDWVGRASADGAVEMRLDDTDLAALRDVGDPPEPPRALAVLATLLAASGDAADRGTFRLAVEGAVGPSGARLLGRFCHADAGVHRIVEEHLRAEEAADPDALHAEVVHLPAGRQGNVVLRPVLRAAEIPYLGRSGAPRDAQVPITDLVVSVREGRVVLRSRRLGRRIEPRLTSAHNTQRRSVPMYRFLSDVQRQAVLAWEWGPLRTLPFLPRVTSGALIVSPATWRVGPDELAGAGELGDAARFAAVHRWRARRDVPARVRVAQHDQRLVVDLRNVLCVDSFLHLAHQHAARDEDLIVQEAMLDQAGLVAAGPEGRFAHELVVPLVREAAVESPRQPTIPPSAPGTATRRFPPGSSWLYAKIFAGPTSADAVLNEVVGPLRDRLRADGWLTGWHFLRYGDPSWHLRVRWHADAARLSGEAAPALHEALAPLLADGRVHRVQLDTYEREVEALGGPAAISHVERLLEADSDAVVDLLATLPHGDAGLDARWRIALLGMHRALLDLGIDLDGRRRLLAALRIEYARQHRLDTPTKRELGRRFRRERAAIESLLADGAAPPAALAGGSAAIARRGQAWAGAIEQLRALDERSALTVSWARLAERVLHLHANRLLRAAARRQECVLYDFLARLYDADVARGGGR